MNTCARQHSSCVMFKGGSKYDNYHHNYLTLDDDDWMMMSVSFALKSVAKCDIMIAYPVCDIGPRAAMTTVGSVDHLFHLLYVWNRFIKPVVSDILSDIMTFRC